jgi:hypothetical protein
MENSFHLQEGRMYACRICSCVSNQIGHHNAHIATAKHESNKTQMREKLHLFYNQFYPTVEYYENKFGVKRTDNPEKFVKWRLRLLNEIQQHTSTPSLWKKKRNSKTPETIYIDETGLEPKTEEYYNWFIEKILSASEKVTDIDDIPTFFIDQIDLEYNNRSDLENEKVMNIKNNIEQYDISHLINLIISSKKSYYIGLIIYKFYKGQYKWKRGFVDDSRENKIVSCSKCRMNNVSKNNGKVLFSNINNKWRQDHNNFGKSDLERTSFKQVMTLFKDELERNINVSKANTELNADEKLNQRIKDIENIIFSLKMNNKLWSLILTDALNTHFSENEPALHEIKSFFKREYICFQNIINNLNELEHEDADDISILNKITNILKENDVRRSVLKDLSLFLVEDAGTTD